MGGSDDSGQDARFPRSLTAREEEVLLALIQRGEDPQRPGITEDDRRRWLAQVPDVVVTGACGCGECPTIDLAGAPDDARQRIVLGAEADGVMVVLFVDDDVLAYVEGFTLDVDRVVSTFPPAAELTF